MAQGLEVLPPKSDKAYPIPCKEWQHIRNRIHKLSDEPFVYQTLGSGLIGACFSTITAILSGSVSSPDQFRTRTISWAITAVTGFVGIACLVFAKKDRNSRRERAEEIAEQMTLIEERFEGTHAVT